MDMTMTGLDETLTAETSRETFNFLAEPAARNRRELETYDEILRSRFIAPVSLRSA